MKKGCVNFDPYKVKARALEVGITQLSEFKKRFYEFTGRVDESVIPGKAWEGKTLRISNAQIIASMLNLKSYSSLLFDNDVNDWEELISSESSTRFCQLMLRSENEKKAMFSFEPYLSAEGLQKVSIKDSFYLRVEGEENESIAAFFISEKEVRQFAPIIINDNKLNCTFKTNRLNYPDRYLPFKLEDGVGWRACLVIKGFDLPINAKHVGKGAPLSLSRESLNDIAMRFLERDVDINLIEFLLV